MSCELLCWGALALLIGAVMVGLGVLLFPRGEKGRDLGRELTDEVETWQRPSRQRRRKPASLGPNT